TASNRRPEKSVSGSIRGKETSFFSSSMVPSKTVLPSAPAFTILIDCKIVSFEEVSKASGKSSSQEENSSSPKKAVKSPVFKILYIFFILSYFLIELYHRRFPLILRPTFGLF